MTIALETRNAITALVRRTVGSLPVRIYLFGSQSRGTARFGSDIDLGIERLDHRPLPPGLLFDLQEAFDNSNIPERVDVVDCAAVSHQFHATALHNAVEL